MKKERKEQARKKSGQWRFTQTVRRENFKEELVEQAKRYGLIREICNCQKSSQLGHVRITTDLSQGTSGASQNCRELKMNRRRSTSSNGGAASLRPPPSR